MIDRKNYDQVQRFLAHHRDVLQHDHKTVRQYRTALTHFLQWADDVPFGSCGGRRPTYPGYLATLTSRHGKPLAPVSMASNLACVRMFLTWLRLENTALAKAISARWIETLRPSRALLEKAELHVIKSYTLEEMHQLMAVPAVRLRERRDRAAAAFIYLSGMRVEAFVSLPLSCVHISERRIEQLPKLGVRTKFTKAAVTTLLPLNDLIAIATEWDDLVSAELPAMSMWFAVTAGNRLTVTPRANDDTRGNSVRKGLKWLCQRAGIPYRGAHALRHGHALYGMQHARTVEDLKALSMNLMHSDIRTTDQVYGSLSAENVRSTIANLGQGAPVAAPAMDPVALLQAMLELIGRDPAAAAEFLGKLRK